MSVVIGSRIVKLGLLALPLLFAAPGAFADVTVSVSGNVATAQIELPDAVAPLYTATVTITFDSATNLTANSLGLTATIIDPNNPPVLPDQVTIDPAFPVVITVEPTVALYQNSFEVNETGNGNLDFLNSYLFEIHTGNLDCSSSSSIYRLYKAPHGTNTFADITSDVYSGSVRTRGRGGAFSQFAITKDARPEFLLLSVVPTIAVGKLFDLTDRLLASTLNGSLLASLTSLLQSVLNDLLALNYGQASTDLGSFIAEVELNAGVGIANEWNADRTLSNDAGELISLAETLQFTLNILQGDAVCLAPPP